MYRNRLSQLAATVMCLCVAATSVSAQSVIYVDGAASGANDGSSWTDAYVSLQDALTATAEADEPIEIRVAQGTYTSRTATGFRPLGGVTLKGGYAGTAGTEPNDRDIVDYATILTGNHVVVVRDMTSPVVIGGFTITYDLFDAGVQLLNASATFADCRFLAEGLMTFGIEAWYSNCVLIRCQFEGSSAHAISFYDGHLTLTDCTFAQAQYGAIDGLGTVDMLRCSFVDNGQAVSWNGTLTARHCTFSDNHADSFAPVSCSGDSTFMNCAFINNTSTAGDASALAVREGHAVLTRCLFQGNANSEWGCGAIDSYLSVTEVSQCLFAGNAGGMRGVTQSNQAGIKKPGAIGQFGAVLRVSNCTFADNRGWPNTIRYSQVANSIGELTQCIVRDGTTPFRGELSVTYSNVEGGYVGDGNTDVDPGFVSPGYWDPNGTPDDPNNDIFVSGDYHLKSQAGHWDSDAQGWVLDEITSPCIDAGDPNGPIDAEPFPNGGFVNMGAYGATAEASRSYFGAPVCETQIAGDINGDCLVDDLDLDILTSHWLMEAIEPVNIPPTIRIISPEDGAELTEPTPIVFRTEALDPDGIVIPIRYAMRHITGETTWMSSMLIMEYSDDWECECSWSGMIYDGTYELWVEGVDDNGERVTSETITITLHPASTE